ncbi:MAG: HAMP domain-containing sensor histidine kinase [Bacteroidota bacterium]
MIGTTRRIPIGMTGKLKILLLVFASLFVFVLLFYSQRITDQLLQREREVVGLYARSIEYINNNPADAGDFSFVFEVIRTIDFPIVQTDADNNPIYWKNIEIDTAALDPAEERRRFAELLEWMDSQNQPIMITANDTLVLNYVHYGESALIQQLRWLPFIELSIAGVFLVIAYIGFGYIRRSEQSNIWVGMAKETAHQLGTPLSSLMGWLERLKSHTQGSSVLVETAEEMEHDIERLNKVAARFSKIGSKPDLKTENVTEIIQGVMSYVGRRLPKSGRKVDLVIRTPGDFSALVNRELFEWVIENLTKNALDAMERSDGKITYSVAQLGTRTTIDVADTGRGIDPKYHKEIFRPGYSTKKRGWGLVLSLSKRIIEDYHKGRLYVKQSALGQGTTFRIRLVE